MARASLRERPTELPSLKFPSLHGRLYVCTWQVMQIQIMQEVSQRTLTTDALDHAMTECHRAFPSPISLGKGGSAINYQMTSSSRRSWPRPFVIASSSSRLLRHTVFRNSTTARSLFEVKSWSHFVVSLCVHSPCEITVYSTAHAH